MHRLRISGIAGVALIASGIMAAGCTTVVMREPPGAPQEARRVEGAKPRGAQPRELRRRAAASVMNPWCDTVAQQNMSVAAGGSSALGPLECMCKGYPPCSGVPAESLSLQVQPRVEDKVGVVQQKKPEPSPSAVALSGEVGCFVLLDAREACCDCAALFSKKRPDEQPKLREQPKPREQTPPR